MISRIRVLGWPSGVEAGKATVFSGSRGEARVFWVQRVGKRKQGASVGAGLFGG